MNHYLFAFLVRAFLIAPLSDLRKSSFKAYIWVLPFAQSWKQIARSKQLGNASGNKIREVIMSLWKPWFALSLILLHAPVLFAGGAIDHPINASNQPPSGPPGPPGPDGKDAPDAYIWAQTYFYSDDDPSSWIDAGNKITFEDPGLIAKEIWYANGDFTLNSGIYQATFQGYLWSVFLDNGIPMGIQFFLNENAIGTAYHPLINEPSDVAFDMPYPMQIQAIFKVSADGSTFSVRGVGSQNSTLYLDAIQGTASTSVMIVKLADLDSP